MSLTNAVIIDSKRKDRESSFAPDLTEPGKFRLKVDIAGAPSAATGLASGNLASETNGNLQAIAELLQSLVLELRLQSLMLAQAFDFNDDLDALRADPQLL